MAHPTQQDDFVDLTRRMGFWRGIVRATNDPDRLGRVKAYVPGITPEGQTSDWAWPMGFPGAGTHQGLYAIPIVGSQVIIGYIQGDPLEPFYLCGNWTLEAPNSFASGVPTEASLQTADNAPKIRSFQTETFEITITETDTTKKLTIKSSDTDKAGFIELDALDGSIHIKARNWLILEGAGVSIDGTKVQIRKRPVLYSAAKPI